MHPITPKTREINALSAHPTGGMSLTTDLHKSDDYEQTGVFESLIEPAHVIRDLDDMDTLKGFSGEWVVQKKPKGKRIMVKKKGKSINPTSLPIKVKKSLKDTIKGDATFDAYVDGDLLTVVDLLVHKDTDMAVEPLSDRVNTLRTLYTTTDNVHFPSPNSCVTTDEDGLMKTIATLDKTSETYILTQAYLDGVNQYIDEGKTPLEFTLVGVKKEKYTIKDIYNVFGYMSFSFAVAHKTDPLLTEIKEKLGNEYLQELMSSYNIKSASAIS